MSQQVDSADLKMGPLEWVLCALLICIVSVTFWQVISRYVIGTSLDWSEELARYLFVWLASLGAAYGFKTKSHFALRFAVDRLSPKGQKFVSAGVALAMAVFLVIFTWKAVEYTVEVSGQIGPGTKLSKAWPASSAAVGGALMLYYMLRSWFDDFRAIGLAASGDEEGA